MSESDSERRFEIGCSIVLLLAVAFLIWVCGLRKVFFYPIQLHVDDVGQYCDTSIFHGIVTEMTFKEMCDVAGPPDEFDTYTEEGEFFCDPIYHFDNGKITCAWTGDQDDRIGLVHFQAQTDCPTILISDILYIPLDCCSINSRTKKVWIYQGDFLYYKISLSNYEVNSIQYWNIYRKKSYTKRRGNYWFYNGNWEPYKSKQ